MMNFYPQLGTRRTLYYSVKVLH